MGAVVLYNDTTTTEIYTLSLHDALPISGGPAMVRSQLVQRTLDLVWHTLREDPERPVRWCPGPRMRMLGLLELTSWNDAPERTQGQVVELLEAGQRNADVQREMCRKEQGGIVRGAGDGPARWHG